MSEEILIYRLFEPGVYAVRFVRVYLFVLVFTLHTTPELIPISLSTVHEDAGVRPIGIVMTILGVSELFE